MEMTFDLGRVQHLPTWMKLVAVFLAITMLATGFALVAGTDTAGAVTRTGNTFWFSAWEVGAWAAAGTAAVVGLLATTGISTSAAWGMVGTVIGVFWTATSMRRCAWVTTRPFSAGTYSC